MRTVRVMVVACALVAAGCGTSDTSAPSSSGGGGGGAAGSGAADGAAGGADATGSGADATGADAQTTGDAANTTGSAVSAPSDLPQGCNADHPCDEGRTCVARDDGEGVCVPVPEDALNLGNPFDEQPASGTPVLDCLAGDWGQPGEPVTMYGYVDRFGSGGITAGMTVRVFRRSEFHPEQCDSVADPGERFQCYANLVADPTLIVGEATSVPPPPLAEAVDCSHDGDCPLGYACAGQKGFEQCEPNYGLYQLDGVPTNTPLVVYVTPADPASRNDWHDTYLYDVVLLERAVQQDANGKRWYRFDPTTVSDAQWKTVPNPFGTQITPPNGAIGGRLRDCGVEGDRRSWPLGGARVGFARPPSRTGYFNDKEEDTLPDPNRTATNILGRYVGLDVEPGVNWVAAAALDGGEVRSLGIHQIYVFPSSLTIVSFPGQLEPLLQPTEPPAEP